MVGHFSLFLGEGGGTFVRINSKHGILHYIVYLYSEHIFIGQPWVNEFILVMDSHT